MLPKMVDDMLEIVLDPIFPPKNPVRQDGRQNAFELIYGEGGTTLCPKPVCVRSPFSKSPYPIKELDPSTRLSNYVTCSESRMLQVGEDCNARSRNASVEEKLQSNTMKNSIAALENFTKNIQSSGYFKSSLDSEFLHAHISRVNSYMLTWKQLTPKEIAVVCGALTAIANSPASIILSDQRNILQMSQVLSDRVMKAEIKITAVITSKIYICLISYCRLRP